jgi:DNA-binding SARP family transcriptional activator
MLNATQGAEDPSPDPILGIGLLGPFLVTVDGDPVELSRLLERALLARLSVAVGEGVSRQRLVDDIWGESPPRDGTGSLQTLVYRLRQSLGAGGSAILTTHNGYSLSTPGDAVDGERFQILVADARKAQGSSNGTTYRAILGRALALWRGPALSGLEDIPFVPSYRTRLNALRMSALKERIEADLAAGLDAELVPELQGLVSEHQFEERFWVQLMLAQYRTGSQADALDSYERLRRVLVEELGIEPGPAARALERSILHHDEALIVKTPGPRTVEALNRREQRLITLLVVDLESRSRLWKCSPPAVSGALRRCQELVADVTARHDGEVVSQMDGAACVAFDEPSKSLRAALDLQRALGNERWDELETLPVSMAIHTGDIEVHDGQLFGPAIHMAASLVRAGHGGQVLVSAAAAELTRDGLPEGSELRDLGHWVLPDTARPVHAYELRHRDLPYAPQALRVGRPGTGTQPLVATTFVGREQELSTVTALVAELPLVSLTGLGGVGKTRLAIEVARVAAATFPEEWWFCDLSAATNKDEVIERMATALGLQARTPDELAAAVNDWLMATPALFVLDNCEQVADPN